MTADISAKVFFANPFENLENFQYPKGSVVNTPLVNGYVVGGPLLICTSYGRVWSTIIFLG